MVVGLCLFLTAGSLGAAPEPPVPSRPFPVRGYHQHVFPDRAPMETFHRRLEVLKKHDYNLVVFGLGTPDKASITMHTDGSINPVGCTTDDLRKLVLQAVNLGLEPVFAMKFIGKQIPLFKELIDEYPNLVIDAKNRATVLNAAFRFPDGRDAYSATALAMVDYLLGLYPKNHPPRYFLLGIDEFSADDMAKLGEKLHMTAPEAFAHCLNLGTDFLLKRGVTPLVWGDTMLSPKLGSAEHGITIPGYRPDPRLTLEAGGAYHAAFGKSRDQGLQKMVDFLRDRDKIIVVDWHYSPSPTGEYPSMDYFQQIGFKDVWGAPWHNGLNIRQFSRYAARRHCGGMVATAWHDAYVAESRLLLHFIIGTSAAYFHNPAIEPPEPGPVVFQLRGADPHSAADGKHTGVILRKERRLTFSASVPEPITATDGRLLITPANRRGVPLETALEWDAKGRELRGVLDLPQAEMKDTQYQVRFCYSDAATGAVYLKNDFQGFVYVDQPPVVPATPAPDVLLAGDFSTLAGKPMPKLPWLGGTCAGPLGWAVRRGIAPPDVLTVGGLDMRRLDRVWFLPSAYLNRELTHGMRIHIEAKMLDTFSGDPYCALLTKGSFSTGFRILVGKDRHVLFQLARLDPKRPGAPLGVRTPAGALPMNQWTILDFVYLPPVDDQHPGKSEIRIHGKVAGRVAVPAAMPLSAAVLGVGCEFRRPTAGPFGKFRPNFPGLIRRFDLRQASPGKTEPAAAP